MLTVESDDLHGGPAALAAAIETRGPASYQVKVDAKRVADVAMLERSGFTVVDVNLTLARSVAGAALASAAGVEVRDARPADADEVLRIAARDLRVSRFHLDPEVPDRVASAIKRDWVGAYLDGARGERLLVAVSDGRPAGFLAVLAAGAARVIDLIAVGEGTRGTGAGRALVARFLELAAAAGAERAEVGTQVGNVGALRFYEELGFRASGARFVLHRHVRPSWRAA